MSKVKDETRKRISKIKSGEDSAIKARLAELRHGVGLMPGEVPALWGMIFEELPDDMLGKYGKPSKEEWAIYDAITLYALHQQGRDPKTESMNVEGISLGKAASKLVYKQGGTEDDRERVSRRFNQIALAEDVETLTYYLRMFVQILRAEEIGIDYEMLAQDIYSFQFESGRTAVRLKWGQDYYSKYIDNKEE